MATAGTEKNILHSSVLDFDSKQADVTLTPNCIVVEHVVKHRHVDSNFKPPATTCFLVPLNEVIAVQPHIPSPGKDRSKIRDGGHMYKAVEMQPFNPTSFLLYIVKRAPKHKWRYKTLMFSCKDHQSCSQWIEKIKEAILATGAHRPQRLLMFINPYGGKRRAPKVFDKVRFLFDLAGMHLDVIETERQFHAHDILQTYDLSGVDGVVAVGGDGTFSEVLNGLLDRSNKDSDVPQNFGHIPARPRLRIGVIPAGSTDAIVFSTVGTSDPITSTIQIILGESIGVDVNALYKKDEFVKYSVTMTSYGYYGDLLADSENLRWMGPKRYNWSGFKKFLSGKAYEGEVAFLLAEESYGHPRDGNICYSGCVVCKRAGTAAEQLASDMQKNASCPTFDLGDGEDGEKAQEEEEQWQRVSGKFVTINTVTISCRSPLSPHGMSPNTHLGDGCMDLILVWDCSRFDYLRHLSRIPRPSADQFDFDFIKSYRVREVQFRPKHDDEEEGNAQMVDQQIRGASGISLLTSSSDKSYQRLTVGSAETLSLHGSTKSLKSTSSRNSVWNCDGELITNPHLRIRVHCQLIKMFAHGIDDSGRLEPERCPLCCNLTSRF